MNLWKLAHLLAGLFSRSLAFLFTGKLRRVGTARKTAEPDRPEPAAEPVAIPRADVTFRKENGMHIELVRYAYTPTETQGRLKVGDLEVFTIEQPWNEGAHPGGEPFESCIPDGDYALVPFTRPNGDKTFAFVNENLGVFLHKPAGPGRYLCLLHPANYADQVQGCAAPGDAMLMTAGRMMVTNSRNSFLAVMSRLPYTASHTLTIRPTQGAQDAR